MRRTDPGDWMWAQACDLIDEAERMHRQFFRLAPSARCPAAWEPPVDVFEDEREIVIVVAMPGVAAERVQVMHERGALVVRGERPLPFAGLAAGRAAARDSVRRLRAPHSASRRAGSKPARPN